GALVRSRFGDEVLERLVDPLVGGINAGDADHLSLAASAPQIGDAARRSRSLLLGLRTMRPAAGGGPAFFTPAGGLGVLVDRLAADLTGVAVRLNCPAAPITGELGAYRIGDLDADAVVVTVPAFAAQTLLAEVAPVAADLLGAIPYAGVAMVTLALPSAAVPRA